MKKAVNVSRSDRAKQYPKGTLHADGGCLFCTSCNITLDHSRKGTIDRHLLTPLHTQKSKFIDETNEARTKKQGTITGAFKAVSEAYVMHGILLNLNWWRQLNKPIGLTFDFLPLRCGNWTLCFYRVFLGLSKS
jgi:hypothetical protein